MADEKRAWLRPSTLVNHHASRSAIWVFRNILVKHRRFHPRRNAAGRHIRPSGSPGLATNVPVHRPRCRPGV